MIQSKYYSVKTHFGSYRGTDWKNVTSAPRVGWCSTGNKTHPVLPGKN